MSESGLQSEETELGRLVHPDSPESLPGVVFVHDVWGPSEHSRQFSDRLARAGFAVLAVDLYRRESKVAITDPGAWMRALSDPGVLSDIAEAAADNDDDTVHQVWGFSLPDLTGAHAAATLGCATPAGVTATIGPCDALHGQSIF